jgi:hypothetical protein
MTIKNINWIVFGLSISLIFISCTSLNKVEISKEKLNDSLPYNDSVAIILATGFRSDILSLNGKKKTITTNESTDLADDFYVSCEKNAQIHLSINNYQIELSGFDCRYSQIVIYKRMAGYHINYFITGSTFD